jgi:hypothetical protein
MGVVMMVMMMVMVVYDHHNLSLRGVRHREAKQKS